MDLAKQSDIMSRFVQVVVSSQPLAENNSRNFIACVPTSVALSPSVPSDIPSDHPTSIFHLHLQPHRCFCLSSLHQSFGTCQAPDNSPRFDSCIWSLLRAEFEPSPSLRPCSTTSPIYVCLTRASALTSPPFESLSPNPEHMYFSSSPSTSPVLS